ncbi:hypothetical protein AWZ03_014144 [Drosophila navojoa]|uniref:Uncharacterized protein n=1 Tax=Drosophila navojoa TaxID=7232 RepID=A0A484AV55_DRONA|nr:hypothetical protein AWZ03_014144 [Drosophila navojoa]
MLATGDGRARLPNGRAAKRRCQLSKWIFETNGIHHVPLAVHTAGTWWTPLLGDGSGEASGHCRPPQREPQIPQQEQQEQQEEEEEQRQHQRLHLNQGADNSK